MKTRKLNSIWLAFPMALLLSTGCANNPELESLVQYVQVERLARPAINEGLVLSPAFLKAFNQISPDLDLSPAAAPVVDEVTVVLSAIYRKAVKLGLDPLGNNATEMVTAIAKGFLPDVMRIDTEAPSGFVVQRDGTLGGVQLVDGAFVMPTGGRLLKQDVGDIVLTYLFDGDRLVADLLGGAAFPSEPGVTSTLTTASVIGDNVTFDGPGGTPNALQGKINGLIASFPYLGKPN